MASAGNGTVTSTPPTTSLTSLPITSSPSEAATTSSTSSDVVPTTPSSSSSSSFIDSVTTSAPTSPSNTPPTSSITSDTSDTNALGESSTSLRATAASTTITSVVTKQTAGGSTVVVTETSTSVSRSTPTDSPAANSASDSAAAAASSSAAAALQSANDGTGGSGKLGDGGKIAIAVVVPIVAVALLVIAGLWFWRKRKSRKNAEELRRKEMEEYGFNPNNDPTVPAVGGASTNGDEASTLREQDAGYRGWGTTSSNTRKASTTLSSQPGMARSDSGGNGYKGQYSPTGNMPQMSDGHSGDPLVGHGDETIGALGAGPAASGNRGGVNRGPSNASSAYSAANRSDVSAISGDNPLPNGSPPYAHDYMYPDESNQNGWDGQPVIREVSARRNTRIENPSIVPQQGNAGIAQNF